MPIVKYLNEKDFSRRRNSSVTKKGKSIFIVFRWFLFFVVAVLLFLGFQVAQAIYKSVWDGVNRLTFALSAEKIALISYNPKDGEVVAVLLPQETQLEVTRGYGKYRIAAIPKLEELEKKANLLVESLQENLGVPVDGWVKTKDSLEGDKNEVKKEEVLEVLQEKILGEGESSLTRWDLVRLWWQIRQLRFDKFQSLNLSNLGVLKTQELPDSTKVLGINSLNLDPKIGKLFIEPQIRKENLSLEVLNGTAYPGLAERVARLLTNIGGDVVFVSNSEVKKDKCEVRSGKEQKETYTVKKIVNIWNCEWQLKEKEGRGEVVVILGDDYWQKLMQK